ncbi:ester cyclase [Streptomyces sp. NPDC050264]|uniref:ester cyclase n=1 Tax=Streptomyces sp. NPDC050264 TaxID=3155038 RepID=UPI003418C872
MSTASTAQTAQAAQTAANKAAFRRLHDAANTGDADAVMKAIDDVVAPDLLFHAPVPMGAAGAQALKKVYAVLLQAFPDLRVRVEDMIAEGDRLVIRNTVTGTHLGDFRGLPPTGKSVTYSEMFVFRFTDGRVAEIWGVVDSLTQLRQLGAVPGNPA